jgi:hypothetical protein
LSHPGNMPDKGARSFGLEADWPKRPTERLHLLSILWIFSIGPRTKAYQLPTLECPKRLEPALAVSSSSKGEKRGGGRDRYIAATGRLKPCERCGCAARADGSLASACCSHLKQTPARHEYSSLLASLIISQFHFFDQTFLAHTARSRRFWQTFFPEDGAPGRRAGARLSSYEADYRADRGFCL